MLGIVSPYLLVVGLGHALLTSSNLPETDFPTVRI